MEPSTSQARPPIHQRNLFLFFSLFMLAGALIGSVMVLYYRAEMGGRLSRLRGQEVFSTNLQSKAIDHLFDAIVGDLFFMSRQNELLAYFADGSRTHLDDIAAEYIQLSGQKRIYDQVRFLAADGMEMVRINLLEEGPQRVPADGLQSKQQRYYFADCFELERGEVFISPFDLNVEHGRIETPLKPVIRLGTVVHDDAGRKRGIVLLNYLGRDLFEKLTDAEEVSAGQTMLLNSDGYWLLSPDHRQAWGFMFDDAERSFAHTFPDAWQQIQHGQQGQLETPQGLFTYRTLYPLMHGHDANGGPQASGHGVGDSSGNSVKPPLPRQPYYWHLVSHVPRGDLDKISTAIIIRLISFGAGLFLIISAGAWFLAGAITKRRHAQDQLKALALFDTLTGLPNRRLFYDRLNAAIRQCRRDEKKFGLFFIDLDGFKRVNDRLGHEAGDHLLCIVADRLSQCMRECDTVARLSGDEFAIVAVDAKTVAQLQPIAARLIDALSTGIALPQGEVRIGASIGASLFPDDSEDGPELLRLADSAMYKAKREGKNRFLVYSATVAQADP